MKPTCDTIIRNATVVDGSGAPASENVDVAIRADSIFRIDAKLQVDAAITIEADGLALAPGFIDAHTHDDTAVILTPAMLPKLSQGVTTVITGNCGISAAPVTLGSTPPDPMNLLGDAEVFRYPTFASYVAAVEDARPAVNVAAFVGHTSLRSNQMDRLDRLASETEIMAMRRQLQEGLAAGALGLSTGLAYLSANAASSDEVRALAEPLAAAGALYATHLRSESDAILPAMEEAFTIGRLCRAPVIVSHLKCAGVDNWGRSEEVLHTLEAARGEQPAGCDCYPYAAGSSTLDLCQVDERVTITITWSVPHPEMGGRTLREIAAIWNITQHEAAARLRPAGAIYHSISEEDMRRILAHPATMIGSDGLPHDPRPHPRLWGTFPRVLGHYCREQNLFSLPEAIRKMTGLTAQRFGLTRRGLVREGYFADLVLFDPLRIIDRGTWEDPKRTPDGIEAVYVNGVKAVSSGKPTGTRSGRVLRRGH